MPIRITAALISLIVLAGCQGDRWAESFVALSPTHSPTPATGMLGFAPIETTDLLLVDFAEALRDRPEADHHAIGYANFTGTW